MTTTNDSLQWPELYGFWIYGNGPSFVIWVEPASISETAGIRIGDRVVELDNRDVSRMSAHAIKYMARTSKSNPPAISVQSFSQEVELSPDPISGSLGLIVRGDMPVVVESVTPNSPAWLAGIRPS
jgi:S1-C subfamily serine protease